MSGILPPWGGLRTPEWLVNHRGLTEVSQPSAPAPEVTDHISDAGKMVCPTCGAEMQASEIHHADGRIEKVMTCFNYDCVTGFYAKWAKLKQAAPPTVKPQNH